MAALASLDFRAPLTLAALATGLLIYCARICDVSLGTIRTLMVVHGRRRLAFVLGFFEVLIWVTAAAKVLHNLDQPFFAVMYALGAASGNFVGMTIERRVALGDQIVRVFTRQGRDVAAHLRRSGFGVFEMDGRGDLGALALLFVEVRRRNAMRAIALAREADPGCQYILDDVRLTSTVQSHLHEPTGWRAILKRK